MARSVRRHPVSTFGTWPRTEIIHGPATLQGEAGLIADNGQGGGKRE